MTAPQPLRLPRFLEPLKRVVADRLQHPEALVDVAEEALVDEGLQRVQIRVCHLLGGCQRAAACEDGQPGEEALLAF